uniref:C3H1-type domain-containing protein n=1 Tax=Eutreptiella gymnastica TaxID=73025 RepID=A0A7S1IUK7_9EUGL|mmetsp:Transcript_43622/g.78486  ORF Transcript_43622/g.78486 Transcript_43622/m.78486 type:complete len:276 (+) Transcript_43622:38-865(+)
MSGPPAFFSPTMMSAQPMLSSLSLASDCAVPRQMPADLNLQLPSELWTSTWKDDVDVGNLQNVLSTLNMFDDDEQTPVQNAIGRCPSIPDIESGSAWSLDEESIGGSFSTDPRSGTPPSGHFAPCPVEPSASYFPSGFSPNLAGSAIHLPSNQLKVCAPENYMSDDISSRGKRNKRTRTTVAASTVSQRDDSKVDFTKYKTRMCRNWQQTGKCPYSESCVYAHGPSELRGVTENEAVVSSLTKLADHLVKQMGRHSKTVPARRGANMLNSLRQRK